jgi:Tol biopolymer transport system component
MDEPDPYVLQFDLEEDRAWRITDPVKTSLAIANNDWQVSPDGKKMVFLSAIDGNLQVLHLPSP